MAGYHTVVDAVLGRKLGSVLRTDLSDYQSLFATKANLGEHVKLTKVYVTYF